jgi:hypothetical protein
MDGGEFQSALRLLARLHRRKTVGYADAWRKRGELISIFPNLARKYDRLVVALDEQVESGDERLADTAADLCVYAAKYLTWFAETEPATFEARPPRPPASACADTCGPEAVEAIFAALPEWEQETGCAAPDSVDGAWQRLKLAFEPLDAGIVSQGSDGRRRIGPAEKIDLAWAIADASAWLLVAIAAESSASYSALQCEVEAMGG